MRMNRTVSALVGLAMLGLTPLAIAGAADAAPAVASASVSTSQLGKPHREVSEGMKKVSGTIHFYGHIKPRYRNKIVYIQRKSCKSCAWHRVDKDRTNSSSNYNVVVGAPKSGRWYFRAKVPASNGYATSYSAGNYYTYRV